MMYQGYMFWVEQAIAYCIAYLAVRLIDRSNSKKQIKE